MKKHDIIKSVSIMAALALSASVFAAESPPPGSLTSAGTQLEAHYSKMLADLKEAIKALEPKVDEGKKAEFTNRIAALGDVPPVTKTVADSNFVKELKGGSSSWINTTTTSRGTSNGRPDTVGSA